MQKKKVVRKKKEKVLVGEPMDEERREAPLARRVSMSEIIGPVMNDAQVRIVTGKTPEYAIRKRVGPSGRTLSYVSHGYVTDQLNKAFGFDWDIILKPMSTSGQLFALEVERIPITKGGKPTGEIKETRHVAVCGDLIVRIHDGIEVVATITKSGFGSQIWLPTMELGDALKAARSDLLKTCAAPLGIALDLYWNDQAEIHQYEKRVEQEQQRREEEKRVAAALNGAPQNPVALIAKAFGELSMTQEDIFNIGSIDETDLFTMSSEEVGKLWNKLVAAGKVSHDES